MKNFIITHITTRIYSPPERAIYGRKLRSVHEIAYVADKYVHPHESYHSVEEVLGWFEKNGFSFIGIHLQTGIGGAFAFSYPDEVDGQRERVFCNVGEEGLILN